MHPHRRRKKRSNYGSKTVEVIRGQSGFGFTISGQQPCILSCIVTNSPADHAGLHAGHYLISVNGINVSKVPHDKVVQLIGNSAGSIRMTVADNYFSDSSEDDCISAKTPTSIRTRPRHTHRSRVRASKSQNRYTKPMLEDNYFCQSAKSREVYCNAYGMRPPNTESDLNTRMQSLAAEFKSPGSNYTRTLNASVSNCYCFNEVHSNGLQELKINPPAIVKNKQQLMERDTLIESKVIIAYLGTIEMPKQIATSSKLQTVRSCIRKLRQEKRSSTLVLMTIVPTTMTLRNINGKLLAEYPSQRINYVSCSSENDYRYFGLVTSSTHIDSNENFAETGVSESVSIEISTSCHVFSIDPNLIHHSNHSSKANQFQIICTLDPVTNECLEFPSSAEYIVNVIRIMYSLKFPTGYSGRDVEDVSKLIAKNYSPIQNSNFNRNLHRPVVVRGRPRHAHANDRVLDIRQPEGDGGFIANSPQPSNHSEITTTSSNSDSGIGFHNDGQNIADKILVVDFAQKPEPSYERCISNRNRQRPLGIVSANFNMDTSFLSNTMPVVDNFDGKGPPLNNDNEYLQLNGMPQSSRVFKIPNRITQTQPSHSRTTDHNIQFLTSIQLEPPHYDTVYTENEDHHYEMIQPKESTNYIEIIEDNIKDLTVCDDSDDIICSEKRLAVPNYSNKIPGTESFDTMTVEVSPESHDFLIRKSFDDISFSCSKSNGFISPKDTHSRKLQSSVDNILMLGLKTNNSKGKIDIEDTFVHPSHLKVKSKKGIKSLKILSKTRQYLQGKDDKKDKKSKEINLNSPCKLSASMDDFCSEDKRDTLWTVDHLDGTWSEPDLRRSEIKDESEQSSPFRRWAGGGVLAHRSYRRPGSLLANSEHDMYSKCSASGRSEDTQGGVSRWSLGLEHLLADPHGAAAFAAFLRQEFSAENITFWWACERYRTRGDNQLAQQIWQRHLAEGAPEPVNVDAPARQACKLRLDEAPSDLFLQCQKQIFSLMQFDSYPRFLRSPIHAECARAELRGQPLPYSPEPLTPSHTPTKLKKSLSNAEERRRSSILPWARLRTGSKDRGGQGDAAQPSGGTLPKPDTIDKKTEVSEGGSAAGGMGGGGCALCRVVLPEGGGCSVVAVDAPLSVRQLVDRLLEKRAIRCLAYDVIPSDDTEPLDVSATCGVLAGRAVRVERRCVLRLEVGARAVAVRCRPEKTLEQVLRPVLQRYCTAPPQLSPTLLCNGRPVALHATAHELDGQRLQVLVTPPGEEVRSKQIAQAKTSQSLDEITNRVFLEVLRGKTAAKCETGSDVGVSGAGKSAGSEGPVVAKVHAGAALLAPPADRAEFLENIKHQQQRLRLKCAPTNISGPKSPSRSENGLPPIPATRTLTKPQPAIRTTLTKSPTEENPPSLPSQNENVRIPKQSDNPSKTADSCVELNVKNDSDGKSTSSSESDNSSYPRTVDPPPLPPKPKVVPTKPPNWGNTVDLGQDVNLPSNVIDELKVRSKKILYIDQPTSSFV